MFSGSFNLATIWSAEVDGLAMQGGAGGQAHWLQSVVSRPFERLVETRVRSLVARLRRADVPCECPLIGVDRKWQADRQSGANDPKRAWPCIWQCCFRW
jgi:hypothetical protein